MLRSVADAAARWRAGEASVRAKTVVVLAVATAAAVLAVLLIAAATA